MVAGLCCGACLFAGTATLSLLPRFVVGGLLIFNGLDLMVDRLWTTRRFLSAAEWSGVLLVLVTVMISGFLSAVMMGLALALVIFVLNYRRVPVIALSTNDALEHFPDRPGAGLRGDLHRADRRCTGSVFHPWAAGDVGPGVRLLHDGNASAAAGGGDPARRGRRSGRRDR